MQRRDFLKWTAGAAGACVSARLWATPTTLAQTPRLLLVLLRGGYDGASLLVPHASDFYYRSRPTIAIARPDAGNPDAALDIGDGYGLHPAVRDTLYALYRRGQVVAVPFSGSTDASRSHFHAQDVIELGQDERGGVDYNSGFLNRLVEVLSRRGGGASGISFTDNLTLSFRGKMSVTNISLKGKVRTVANDRQLSLLQEMYRGRELGSYVQSGMETRKEVAQNMQQEMVNASRGARNVAGFDQAARTIGTLMRDHSAYSVAFVDAGGWDTHINQGGADGQLARQLTGLASGLTVLAQTLGDVWAQTTVVVVSEFGRTFRENGDKGTDHGHGNTLWALGGGLTGGRLAGERVEVNERMLFQDRDFPVLNDYRSVLSYIARRTYGLNAQQLNYVFPAAPVHDYHFI